MSLQQEMKKVLLRSLCFETCLKITLVSSVFSSSSCVEKESFQQQRSLCFPSKRIWDSDYTRLQQNRKLSLTGNETSLQTKSSFETAPPFSIFFCTMYIKLYKNDPNISLNIEKKFERSAQQLKPCQRREKSEEIWSWPNLTQNNPFNFATTLIPEFIHHRWPKSLPRILIDRQFIKHEPPFRRVLHQVQFAFQCRDSRTNSRRIVAVSLEPGRTRPF